MDPVGDSVWELDGSGHAVKTSTGSGTGNGEFAVMDHGTPDGPYTVSITLAGGAPDDQYGSLIFRRVDDGTLWRFWIDSYDGETHFYWESVIGGIVEESSPVEVEYLIPAAEVETVAVYIDGDSIRFAVNGTQIVAQAVTSATAGAGTGAGFGMVGTSDLAIASFSVSPGVPPAPPVLVYRLPDFELVNPQPSAAFGVSCMVEKNGTGSGSFSTPLDDPSYGVIGINDVVAVMRGGEVVQAFVIEEYDEHTLDEQEGSHRTITYVGRGVGVFLEWAVVFPADGDQRKPIEDDSVWDWRSSRYDPADDPWEPANEIMSVATAEAGAWPHQPMGQKFDLTTGAQMIGGPSGDDAYAPMGWTLGYIDINVEVTGRHAIELLMDDKGTFWGDTVEELDIPAEDGFVTASFKRLNMTAGVHRFCFAWFNFEDPENPGFGLGPSAMAFNFYKADLQDRPLAGGQYVISDSNVQVLEVGDDPWPGMTIGEDFADNLLPEAQARNKIPWVEPSFDKMDDSNGDPWDREVGITTKTGTTNYLQFLDELVAANRISQWRCRLTVPTVTFDLFAPGYSNPSGVTLDPAPVDDPRTGQLVQLDRRVT